MVVTISKMHGHENSHPEILIVPSFHGPVDMLAFITETAISLWNGKSSWGHVRNFTIEVKE